MHLQLGNPTQPPLLALQDVLFSKRSKPSRRIQGDPTPGPQTTQGSHEFEAAETTEECITHSTAASADIEKADKPGEQGWLPWNWGGSEAVQSL